VIAETVSFAARAGTTLSQNRAAKPVNLVIAFEGIDLSLSRVSSGSETW